MHPNPIYRRQEDAARLAFAGERGFGVLSISAPDGPLAAHAPFVLTEDGGAVEMHLVRSNPLVRALAEPQKALLAVSGPDAYVSPDWYGLGPDQVPTWNYVAAHLRGTLSLLPAERLREHLARLSEQFERRLAPKPPWTLGKLTAETYAKLSRMIIPARMTIEHLDGTWKANQNKPDEARRAAALALEACGAAAVGSQPAVALAALMRGQDAPMQDTPMQEAPKQDAPRLEEETRS